MIKLSIVFLPTNSPPHLVLKLPQIQNIILAYLSKSVSFAPGFSGLHKSLILMQNEIYKKEYLLFNLSIEPTNKMTYTFYWITFPTINAFLPINPVGYFILNFMYFDSIYGPLSLPWYLRVSTKNFGHRQGILVLVCSSSVSSSSSVLQ